MSDSLNHDLGADSITQTASSENPPITMAHTERKKIMRVQGGNAAVPKPITADYDEEDGRIVQMKLQGYTDKQTAEALRQEGFTNYQDRTIGSRWARLRQLLEEEDDKKLDDEMSDWHLEEDHELVAAYKLVDEKILDDIKRIQDKRWSHVSHIMAARLRKKKFSGNACQERWEGIQQGTALKAIELDSDPEGRRKMCEERIAKAKAARAAAKAQDEANQLAQEAEQQKRVQARHSKAMEKAAKSEKKRDEERRKMRIKAESRMKQQKAREDKQAALKLMKAERDWVLERSRKEKEIYKRLTGKDLNTELKEARESISALHSSGHGSVSGTEDPGDRLAFSASLVHDTDLNSDIPDGASNASANLPSSGIGSGARAGLAPSNLSPSAPCARFRTPVTKTTLLNARSVLTDAELDALVLARGLSRRGRSETHAQLVARLAAADWELVVPDLKDLLRARGARVEGRKEEMIRRLQDADAAASFQGEMGVRADQLEFMRAYEPYARGFAHVLAEAEAEALTAAAVEAAAAEAKAAAETGATQAAAEAEAGNEEGVSAEVEEGEITGFESVLLDDGGVSGHQENRVAASVAQASSVGAPPSALSAVGSWPAVHPPS